MTDHKEICKHLKIFKKESLDSGLLEWKCVLCKTSGMYGTTSSVIHKVKEFKNSIIKDSEV